jgi:hypothetical protein
VEIRSWFVHLTGAKTVMIARCFTDLSLLHPPKPPSQTNRRTDNDGEKLLREFWMNEEKGLHLGRNGVPSIQTDLLN